MNTEIKVQPTHLERENDEVKKYLNLIQEQGYGHTIAEQEKRVRAGIAIAHHIHRKEVNNFYPMLEALKEAYDYILTGKGYTDITLNHLEAAIKDAEQTT